MINVMQSVFCDYLSIFRVENIYCCPVKPWAASIDQSEAVYGLCFRQLDFIRLRKIAHHWICNELNNLSCGAMSTQC